LCALTMLSWDALLGVYAQNGYTPLCMACCQGRVTVVKLLLAHPGVDINKADKVRERGGAGRERESREGRQAGCTLGDAAEGGSPHTHSRCSRGVHYWTGMFRNVTRR
jgi:hypothetical protein